MNRRSLLVALLVVSTGAFVVGVSVERSSGDSHDEPAAAAESNEAAKSGEAHAEEGAEGEASETGEEAHGKEAAAEAGEDEAERLLGVDLEATPFVVLAAAVSLGLAVAVWLRPEWPLLLGLVAAAMIAFAAVDVREVVHQLDEDNGGLAALAGVVTLLHLAAAAVALSMGRSPAVAPRDSLA
jgi:hypothetical protein